MLENLNPESALVLVKQYIIYDGGAYGDRVARETALKLSEYLSSLLGHTFPCDFWLYAKVLNVNKKYQILAMLAW